MLAVADPAVAISVVSSEIAPRHLPAREHAVLVAVGTPEITPSVLHCFGHCHPTITVEIGTAQLIQLTRCATIGMVASAVVHSRRAIAPIAIGITHGRVDRG